MKRFSIPKACTLPNLQDILFIILFSSVFLFGTRMLNLDGDIFRHLSIGRFVVQNSFIPTTDIFSHTVNGTKFSPHEWLAGLLFYLVYSVANVKGLVFLAATIIAFTFLFVYKKVFSLSQNSLFAYLLTALGAMGTALHWIVRPHLFSMLLTVVWIVLLDKVEKESVKKVILPIFFVMLFWVNTHGEFIFGFLIILSYFAGAIWDWITENNQLTRTQIINMVTVAFVAFVASIINPVGIRVWGTILNYVGNNYLVSNTLEYQSPNFINPAFGILLILITLSILLLGFRERPIRAKYIILLAGITLMTLVSARNVHLYGVVAPITLGATFVTNKQFGIFTAAESVISKFDKNKNNVLWPIIIMCLVGTLLANNMFGNSIKFSPSFFPIEAVRWLKENPQQGNGYNFFSWGGYLIYNLWPEKTVFIDPQTDVYGETVTRKYVTVYNSDPGWQNIFGEYDLKWAILPPGTPIESSLIGIGWQIKYQDATAVILSD